MELPSLRQLIGKVDSKGNAIYPQENNYTLYETLIELFTSEKDMVGHIYANVCKMSGVATVKNRGFWGVESNKKMVEEGCTAVANYILTTNEKELKEATLEVNLI